jgi:SAM-dependent methyltransferase
MSLSRPPLFSLDERTLLYSQRKLDRWYKGPLGQRFLNLQRTMIGRYADRIFGDYLLQIGSCSDVVLHDDLLIRQKFMLCAQAEPCSRSAARVDPLRLPFENASMDAVLVHHTTEYVNNPHLLFKELSRVLSYHGYFILVGFNPWSLWGVYSHFVGLFSKESPWRSHGIAPSRAEDWLRLLDFNIIAVDEGPYIPLKRTNRYLPRLKTMERWAKKLRLPGGTFYVIIAQKEVAPLTPERKRWRPKPLVGLGSPEPGYYGQVPDRNK